MQIKQELEFTCPAIARDSYRSNQSQNGSIQKLKKIGPWITAGLVISIRTKDKISKQSEKLYNPELKLHFLNYQNTLKSSTQLAKENYFRRKIVNAENNNKLLGENISVIMGINQKGCNFR